MSGHVAALAGIITRPASVRVNSLHCKIPATARPATTEERAFLPPPHQKGIDGDDQRPPQVDRGQQVCEKWLKDRKGRKLSYDDIAHYERVVMALGLTRDLMAQIDARIPGWPVE